MAERCGDCGTFKRTARGPSGDYWLCATCESEEDEVISSVKEIVTELFGKEGREDTAAIAFGLADAIDFEDLFSSGKSAEGVAAACVYVASILAGEKITQPEIAEIADVSVTSIRDTHQTVYRGSGFEDHYGPIEGGELDPDQPHPWFDVDGWKDRLLEDHSPNAAKASASNVRRFAVWYEGDGPPTEADVRAWFDHLVDEDFAPSTIEGRYNALRNYMGWVESDVDFDEIDINEYVSRAWQQRVG